MTRSPRRTPYYSQWESRDLTSAILREGAETVLLRDPAWRSSGAQTIEEYSRWAGHVCGMACLKMILAARTGTVVPTLELARQCTEAGGYVVDPDTGRIRGLIYAPLVGLLRERYGISAAVLIGLTAVDLPSIMQTAEFFIASVHHAIRWPEQAAPGRGGHLVLVTAATSEGITFHNPSGHDPASQEGVTLPLPIFDGFFAGRGIRIDAETPLSAP